jgi:hypothetical protein
MHAHHTQNNTEKTATPKAANVSMNQNKFTSTVHAPSGRRASIAIISFSQFADTILPDARTMQDITTNARLTDAR